MKLWFKPPSTRVARAKHHAGTVSLVHHGTWALGTLGSRTRRATRGAGCSTLRGPSPGPRQQSPARGDRLPQGLRRCHSETSLDEAGTHFKPTVMGTFLTSISHPHASKTASEILKTETFAASQDKPAEIKMTLRVSSTHLTPERQPPSSQNGMS